MLIIFLIFRWIAIYENYVACVFAKNRSEILRELKNIIYEFWSLPLGRLRIVS